MLATENTDTGKQLGSSACPIFTVFSNMEDVKNEVIAEASEQSEPTDIEHTLMLIDTNYE